MKNLKASYIVFAFLLASLTGLAQEKSQDITLSGTKFTYPLVEKWITEYSKANPGVKLNIAAKGSDTKVADLKVIAHTPSEKELAEGEKLFLVGRYALLPVLSNTNPLLNSARKKALDKKALENLFFDADIFADNSTKKAKEFDNLNIYSREGRACATIAFAEFFGHEPSEIKGKKISGDDIYLLSAIQKDSLGVTFNNLGYIYDIQSRKIKNGISVLPVDLKKESGDALNKDIDQTIQILENNSFETIPVDEVGFVFNYNDAGVELKDFLKWVVTEGQKYNHEYGFLNLSKEALSAQLGLLDNKYLTSRN